MKKTFLILAVFGRLHGQKISDLAIPNCSPLWTDAGSNNVIVPERWARQTFYFSSVPGIWYVMALWRAINLRAMNLLLLKKVEELTLYLIAQIKPSELLREWVKELEDKERMMEEKL